MNTTNSTLSAVSQRLILTLLGALGLSAAIVWLGDSAQRLVLCLSALLVLLAAAWFNRSGSSRQRTHRRARSVLLALLAPLALAAAWQAAGHDLIRFATTPRVRVWNVFHYYLGAEYFGEVGYFSLYDAALLADRENTDYWHSIRRVRDQRSYDVGPLDPALGELARTHFSAERWQRFQTDIAALQPLRSAKRWRSIFVDRGYNASPFWTALIHPLTHFLRPSHPLALKILCTLDLLILAAIFVIIGRTFGANLGWIALLIFALSPVDRNRIVGGFLQYDWLLALTVAVCALRRRKTGWAAVGLAYATLERVFPLLLAGSLLLPAVVRWIRSGRLRRDALQFALLYGVLMLAGLGVGCLTPRGPAAWMEFTGNVLHHGESHTFGEQRVGLKHLFTHRVTSSQLEDNSSERRQRFERQETLYRGVAIVLLLLWFGAVHRRFGTEALLLGLVPFFALLVSSRYYWACLLLVPLAPRGRVRGRSFSTESWRAAGAVLAGFGSFYLCALIYGMRRYGEYLLFDLLLLVAFATWSAYLIRRELLYSSRRRV